MRHFHLASINHRLVGLSLSLLRKGLKVFLFPLFRNGEGALHLRVA